MYPARWFPVNGYTVDRYTADLRITVPTGFKVVASGLEHSEPAGADKTRYDFQYTKPSFPGSIAVVQGEPMRGGFAGREHIHLFPQEAIHGQRLRRRDRQDHELSSPACTVCRRKPT